MSAAARLGYDPFSATAAKAVIAQIEEKSGNLEGRVEPTDDDNVSEGARKLSAPVDRCSELVRAMALSISIAIDPETALLARDEPAPSPRSDELEPTEAPRDGRRSHRPLLLEHRPFPPRLHHGPVSLAN